MDNSIVLKLVKVTYITDDIGQKIAQETSRTIYGQRGAITRAEWATAGQQGLNPELEVKVFTYDYDGESIVEIGDQRYGVYRTYRRDDTTELYLERKAGI